MAPCHPKNLIAPAIRRLQPLNVRDQAAPVRVALRHQALFLTPQFV
jgi:hypothetical protein